MKLPPFEFVRTHDIERPDRRGSYRWTTGYSWRNPDTGRLTVPPMTRRECHRFANIHGRKSKFLPPSRD